MAYVWLSSQKPGTIKDDFITYGNYKTRKKNGSKPKKMNKQKCEKPAKSKLMLNVPSNPFSSSTAEQKQKMKPKTIYLLFHLCTFAYFWQRDSCYFVLNCIHQRKKNGIFSIYYMRIVCNCILVVCACWYWCL